MENNSQTKPNLVMVIALMTLVNGIFNILWGVSLIVGTFGILLICFPISLFPILLGAFEIAYAMKFLAVPPQPVKPSLSIAYWEIAAILVGNVFSLVVGILALVFYNDSIVKDYFARLNGTQTPPPTPPMPAPVLPAESAPEVPAPAPLEPETPEAPKRRPRKVA
jgi:hypothetical protein